MIKLQKDLTTGKVQEHVFAVEVAKGQELSIEMTAEKYQEKRMHRNWASGVLVVVVGLIWLELKILPNFVLWLMTAMKDQEHLR